MTTEELIRQLMVLEHHPSQLYAKEVYARGTPLDPMGRAVPSFSDVHIFLVSTVLPLLNTARLRLSQLDQSNASLNGVIDRLNQKLSDEDPLQRIAKALESMDRKLWGAGT